MTTENPRDGLNVPITYRPAPGGGRPLRSCCTSRMSEYHEETCPNAGQNDRWRALGAIREQPGYEPPDQLGLAKGDGCARCRQPVDAFSAYQLADFPGRVFHQACAEIVRAIADSRDAARSSKAQEGGLGGNACDTCSRPIGTEFGTGTITHPDLPGLTFDREACVLIALRLHELQRQQDAHLRGAAPSSVLQEEFPEYRDLATLWHAESAKIASIADELLADVAGRGGAYSKTYREVAEFYVANLLLLVERNEMAHDAWRRTGWGGNLMTLFAKVNRLMHALWWHPNSDVRTEKPLDHFGDAATYAAFCAILFRAGDERGSER
jgi:hypothetical protein